MENKKVIKDVPNFIDRLIKANHERLAACRETALLKRQNRRDHKIEVLENHFQCRLCLAFQIPGTGTKFTCISLPEISTALREMYAINVRFQSFHSLKRCLSYPCLNFRLHKPEYVIRSLKYVPTARFNWNKVTNFIVRSSQRKPM